MRALLLVRHGEAVESAPGGDDHRWLTAHGRAVTRSVAARLATAQRTMSIWTSPLVRAVQTAEIVASAVELNDTITVVSELATGDHARIARRVKAFNGAWPLCLVGHEPTLSALVLALVGTRSGSGPQWPGFDKSDVCCLTLDGNAAHVAWVLRAGEAGCTDC